MVTVRPAFSLIKEQLYHCTVFYSRRLSADLLSHRRDQEDQQSQGLHVVLAFLPHPEVQSLPGSLVDPSSQISKPQYTQNQGTSYLLYVTFELCKCTYKQN